MFRFSVGHALLVVSFVALVPGCKPAATHPPKGPDQQAVESKFENPGGMWMPTQMPQHRDTLYQLGVRFDPAKLQDPTAFPLAAVVSLGGCSGSFVSPQGLVITNHHCVVGALQHNSSPAHNRLAHGYLAATRADELPAGHQQIYVTQKITDVSEQMQQAAAAAETPKARFDLLEARAKELEQSCEAAQPGHSCSVRSFFEGAEYHLVDALAIRDVRLVFAPDAGIGVFGGEVDNWRWPRHTGDFAFLRAYVGPDGKPADPSPDNVPYKPPFHLSIAAGDLQPGDFVMVAGYPGRTNRLSTADEVSDAMQWHYPHSIERFRETLALLDELGKGQPELAIKAAGRMRSLANAYTNYQGMLEGLEKGGLAERKRQEEAKLRSWIDADAKRKAKYGAVLEQLAALDKDFRQTREHDGALHELMGSSHLLGNVVRAVRSAEGDETKLHRELVGLKGEFDGELERASLALALQRAGRLPEAQRPDDELLALVGDLSILADPARTRAVVDRLYDATKLADPKARAKLLAKPKQRKWSRDPFVKLAMALAPAYEALEEREQTRAGARAVLRPQFVAALREFKGKPIAPDANGTLRITFGTVRGYAPGPDVAPFAPFSTLGEMLAKNTGDEPFAAPPSLTAASGADKGPYVDPRLKDVPLDFLADLDITGGNSGSATLNAKGELVGLVFDGNYESIASNWMFMPTVTRSIHVDIRFVQWVLDAVVEGDHLLEEMGVEPQLDVVRPSAEPEPTRP